MNSSRRGNNIDCSRNRRTGFQIALTIAGVLLGSGSIGGSVGSGSTGRRGIAGGDNRGGSGGSLLGRRGLAFMALGLLLGGVT